MSFAIGSIPIIPPRSTGWWHGYWPGPAWRMRRRFADSCAAPMPRPGCDDNRDGRLPVPVFMMREPLYTDGRRPPPSGPFLCGGRRRLSRPLAERRPVSGSSRKRAWALLSAGRRSALRCAFPGIVRFHRLSTGTVPQDQMGF